MRTLAVDDCASSSPNGKWNERRYIDQLNMCVLRSYMELGAPGVQTEMEDKTLPASRPPGELLAISARVARTALLYGRSALPAKPHVRWLVDAWQKAAITTKES